MNVHGSMKFQVSVPVEATEETLGLLEANYRFNPNRIIGYELTAVDCKGNRNVINVNENIETTLGEVVEY